MIYEPFAVGNSIIHRIDPRFKVVSATLFSIVVAVSYRFPTLLSALAMAGALILAANLDLRAVSRRLLVAAGFLALLWVVVPFTYEGAPLYRIGFLTITRPGVTIAARISLKSIAILSVFIALITTMNFSALGHALDQLRLPGKFVHLLLLTYRYLTVIEQEYGRLVRAAKIRGFRPKTNLHTYRTIAYLIGMLFVRSAARAERVDQAMRCRGFSGRFYCLSAFSRHWSNWVFGWLMTVFTLGLEVIEVLSAA